MTKITRKLEHQFSNALGNNAKVKFLEVYKDYIIFDYIISSKWKAGYAYADMFNGKFYGFETLEELKQHIDEIATQEPSSDPEQLQQ